MTITFYWASLHISLVLMTPLQGGSHPFFTEEESKVHSSVFSLECKAI